MFDAHHGERSCAGHLNAARIGFRAQAHEAEHGGTCRDVHARRARDLRTGEVDGDFLDRAWDRAFLGGDGRKGVREKYGDQHISEWGPVG